MFKTSLHVHDFFDQKKAVASYKFYETTLLQGKVLINCASKYLSLVVDYCHYEKVELY